MKNRGNAETACGASSDLLEDILANGSIALRYHAGCVTGQLLTVAYESPIAPSRVANVFRMSWKQKSGIPTRSALHKAHAPRFSHRRCNIVADT